MVPPDEPYFIPSGGSYRTVVDDDDVGTDEVVVDVDVDDDLSFFEAMGLGGSNSLLYELESDPEVLKASMNLLATPHSEENKEGAIAVVENVQMMCAADFVRLGCAPADYVAVSDMNMGNGGEGGLLSGLSEVLTGLFFSGPGPAADGPVIEDNFEGQEALEGGPQLLRHVKHGRRRRLFDANIVAAHSPLPRRGASIMPARMAPLLPYHFPQHHLHSNGAASDAEDEAEQPTRRRRLSSGDIDVDPMHMGGLAARIQTLVDGLRATTGLDVNMVWHAIHGLHRRTAADRRLKGAKHNRHAHTSPHSKDKDTKGEAAERGSAEAVDGGRRAYKPKKGEPKSPSEGDSDSATSSGTSSGTSSDSDSSSSSSKRRTRRELRGHGAAIASGRGGRVERLAGRPTPPHSPPPPAPMMDPEERQHLHDLAEQYRPPSPREQQRLRQQHPEAEDGDGEGEQWSHTTTLGFGADGDMCMMSAYANSNANAYSSVAIIDGETGAPAPTLSAGCREAIGMAEQFRSEYWAEEAALVGGGHRHCHGGFWLLLAVVGGVWLYKRRCSKEARLRKEVRVDTQEMVEMLHANPEVRATVENAFGKPVPPPMASLPRPRFLAFMCRVVGCLMLAFFLTVTCMAVTGHLLAGLVVTDESGDTHGPPGGLVLLVFVAVAALETALAVGIIRGLRCLCGQGCCWGSPAPASSNDTSTSPRSRWGAALTAGTGMLSSAVNSAGAAVASAASSASPAPSTTNRRGYAPLSMQNNDTDGDGGAYYPMNGGSSGAEMTTFSSSSGVPVASAPPAPYAPPPQQQQRPAVYYTGVPVAYPPPGPGYRREYQA